MAEIGVGDRVMVSPDHPSFAREWLGMWGHVVGEGDSVSFGYPSREPGRRMWRVRVGGQVGVLSAGVRELVGSTVSITEAVLVHPD